MKSFIKSIGNAILDKLAMVLITVVISGFMAACNHKKIVQDNQWVGQHLQDKQAQINELKNSK